MFQIVSGPLAGKYWYWSEESIPNVGVGQTVAGGQTVATKAPSRTGIKNRLVGAEPWLAARRRGAVESYTEEHGTPAGGEFQYLLEQVGAKPRDRSRRSLPPSAETTVYAEP